jgi:hypothetical protein
MARTSVFRRRRTLSEKPSPKVMQAFIVVANPEFAPLSSGVLSYEF